MKNRKKRLLSMILAILMVLSSSMTAFATETNTETGESTVAEQSQGYVAAETDLAYNTSTLVGYDNLQEALHGASEGQTVAMVKDVETTLVMIPEKVTLDLAGWTLDTQYVTCYGDIVDNTEDNSGLLKVEPKRFLIRTANAQMPVKTEEGYKFFALEKWNVKYVAEGSKYAFQPFVEAEAHEYLLAGAEESGVSINVRVSWKQNDGVRSQDFVYTDKFVADYLNSYNEETNKYGRMFTLTLKGTDGFEDLSFCAILVSETGVEHISEITYVENEEVPDESEPETEDTSSNVTTDENNQVTDKVTLGTENASAVVSEGTQLDAGTTALTLKATDMDTTTSDVTLGENEEMRSLDVHVAGVAESNTVPVIITLDQIAPEFLNQGNIRLYHVENGVTMEMTRVFSLAEVDEHNEYYYDIETGTLTVAMATFSEIAVVSDTEAKWEGKFDYTWYDASKTELTIANADQLAAFGAIVGGMAKDENGSAIAQDSFGGKTVKLIADINLGDKESENNPDVIFYPIGYYNSTGSYEKTSGGSVTSSVSSFEGTFDGNGHTISNFYQNTWEMFGGYNSGYSGTPNHYDDAMGLFGYVVNGTVKNLTVNNFSSDGEFTPTGVIAAYAVNSTFENIAITNCNPRVYNTGNGGIVGIGGNSNDPDTYKLTFNNITIDNTNKITALWGSWDVACGGLIGMFRGAGHVYMTNCHVAAQIDVYNDVCGNYQYYWYRYSGMMVGTNKNMITDDEGYTVPETSKFHAENCTVHFGEWNDYYYCELVANSLASYTHDHQFSRLTQISSLDEIKSGDTWTKTGNFLLISGNTKTCYHIVKNADGTLKQHLHADAGTEVVNGVTVDKEDNKIVYLPFNQLFTGYGWGVKHIPIYDDGTPNPFAGVTILDRVEANSVKKFDKADTAKDSYTTGTTVTIGELFKAATIEDEKLTIKGDKVQVTVSPVGENSTAGGTYIADTTDWTQGTLTFSGIGAATVTITDYYFCTPTTINVTITEKVAVEKFESKFTGNFLYRVGNQNTVSIGSLFEAKDGAKIGTVEVTVEKISGATGTYTANATWTNGTIQFSGTGVVKVTITDNDSCTPTVLLLEVVNAKNIIKAESATANDVVLLNDISGTFVVSGGHTFYGNGFTVILPTTSVKNVGNGFTGYISIGGTQDDGNANGGHLDNVRIEGPVYPEMYIYRDQAKITNKSDPDYGDGYNMRYFVNSVIVYGGNCTISNSYISGSRTALCLRGGNNVVIENTTLSGGAYANMQICAGSSVTLRNLTTVQVGVKDSYGKGKTAHGLGIVVDSAVVDIYIEGELNQNNWLNKTIWDEQVPSAYQSSFPDFFGDNKYSDYWHYLNGETDKYVNLAFVFACNWDTSKIHDKRTTVDYVTCDSTIAGVAGGVYSKVNTAGGNAIEDTNLGDPGYTSPGFEPIAPTLNFDNTPNDDADDVNDANDTYCVYNESTGTLKIGVSGASKTLDLSKVYVAKNGDKLVHTAYLNGTPISGTSVTINTTDGAKQTLTFKATSNDAGYDKNGTPIKGSIEYTWNVTVEVATLSYPAPEWNMGGDYQFDTTNCVYAYYGTTNGYGEAVPIYEDIKINYYDKSGKLVELDLSGTKTHPTGSNNSNSNAFTYTLADGSTLTMKFSSGWKSGATTHQFTTYKNKVYIYPQSLDNDNYIRAKVGNQDFDVKISYTFTDPNGQSISQTMQWYNAKADNSKVTTVQWKTFDSANGKKPSCITADTLLTLADGTQKRIDELTMNDRFVVWDFVNGEFAITPAAIINNHGMGEYTVVTLIFSDGTSIKTINGHGFYHRLTNEFIMLDENNVNAYLNHDFLKQDMETVVQLVDYSIELEEVECWSILTAEYHNAMLNGMFTLTPGEVEGSEKYLMPFKVGEDLKYDPIAREADIAQYGLYTYEDFADLVTEEQFYALNLPIFKVSVGKGYITYDDIVFLLELHMN